ncbi:RNA methyltransferase [uncultured Muribaculum sp.]|jgi:tRNA G18 (ribose-2'-O)-methylase SpoU|uniref:RNA methyltransferase n=1 Tax=uncultured Muribaculum sp. TaxID=1918613 RepID=UPI0025B232A8|nr:RNA methyltransferase [uncultured Muribaculum sp.]
MKKKTIWDLQRMSADEFKQADKLPVVLVLDNVRSLSNVGAMLRTADAFSVEKVLLCGVTGTPPSVEIHKTALGAEDSVDWVHCDSTTEAVDALKHAGYRLCVLEQVEGSVLLNRFEAESGQKYAIVVGHEVNGVDQAVVDRADVCLEIPQFGTKHSLNVSVSAGIALWQIVSRLI